MHEGKNTVKQELTKRYGLYNSQYRWLQCRYMFSNTRAEQSAAGLPAIYYCSSNRSHFFNIVLMLFLILVQAFVQYMGSAPSFWHMFSFYPFLFFYLSPNTFAFYLSNTQPADLPIFFNSAIKFCNKCSLVYQYTRFCFSSSRDQTICTEDL